MHKTLIASQTLLRNWLACSAAVLAPCALPSFAQVPLPPVVTDYPRDGVDLGYGWFSAAGTKVLAICIDFDTHNDPAQTKNVEIKSISDKSSLMQRLNVSAEVQVKAVVASVSAKTSFASSTDFESESSTFAVRAVVQNGVESVVPTPSVPVRLKENYRNLARSNPSEFFRQCGDSFVAARYGGAELWSLISFANVKTEETEQLKVEVQGSGWNVFSASGSTSTEMKKSSDQKNLTIQYAESGGAGDPIPTDQNGLITAVQNLPSLAHNAPSYTQIELVRYEALGDWPGGVISTSQTDFQKIASRFEQFTALQDEIHRIQKTPSNYVLGHGVTLDGLQAVDQQLYEHIQRLNKTAQTCNASGFANCKIDPKDDITDYQFRAKLPVPKLSFLEDWIISVKSPIDIAAARRQLAFPGGTPQFYAQVRATLSSYIQQFNHAQAEYPAALRRAIGSKWISSALHDRCDADPGSVDCISPDDEARIISQINIQYTPVPIP